jgi:hypothetical protein
MGRCFSNQSDKRSADVQVPAAWLSESSTLMRQPKTYRDEQHDGGKPDQ